MERKKLLNIVIIVLSVSVATLWIGSQGETQYPVRSQFIIRSDSGTLCDSASTISVEVVNQANGTALEVWCLSSSFWRDTFSVVGDSLIHIKRTKVF